MGFFDDPSQSALPLGATMQSTPQGPSDLFNQWLATQLGGGRDAAAQAQKYTNLLNLTPLGLPQTMYDAGQMIGGGAQKLYNAPSLGGAAQLGGGLVMGALGAMPGGRALDEALAPAADEAISALTKKAQKAALVERSGFLPSGDVPIVTQAAERNLPLGGADQLAMQHTGGYSPFAWIKPRTPLSELSASYDMLPGMTSRQSFDPAQLENAWVMPLIGDRTEAGGVLTNINGVPLRVGLHGGPGYAEANALQGSPAGWASDKAPIGTLRARLQEAFGAGAPHVYGIYSPMGPRSLDQTTMMTDALLQQTQQAPILKKNIKAFDQQIKQSMPDFPGVLHPNAQEYLQGLSQGQRLKFVDAMDTSSRQAAGFPDVASTRMALTVPALRDMPAGAGGYSVVKFGPEALQNLTPTLKHPTYPVQMRGAPMGGMQPAPYNLLFPQWTAARRAAGTPAGADLYTFEKKKPIEQLGPQGFDALMSYLNASRQ